MECAAAGTAWLLQFIEDLQQSRDFHKTCELILPNEAATIPEVCSFKFLTQPYTNSEYTEFISSYEVEPVTSQGGNIRKPV